VQRHAFNIVLCLLELPQIRSIELVIAPWQQQMVAKHISTCSERLRIHVEDLRNTSWARNAWFYYRLPIVAREHRADLIHLAYPAPLNRNAFAAPTVVSLHDLYPYDAPRNFGTYKAWAYRRLLQQCLRAANLIACVSDSTLSSLKRHSLPSIWTKALRIYNCVERSECQPCRPSTVVGDESFLLCVAQHRYNKNVTAAIQSLHWLLQTKVAEAPTRLLVIGISGPETRRLQDLATRLAIQNRVIFMQGLSESELFWCYLHCAAVIVPSHVEGFGLPAVEALLSGSRLICADIPALREVAGDQAVFASLAPDPAVAFAHAILESLQSPSPQPVTLPQFSRAQISQEYLAAYQNVLALSRQAAPLSAASGALITKGHRYD
jgi:glycosyltransferase involved in cell wall biosynthesis